MRTAAKWGCVVLVSVAACAGKNGEKPTYAGGNYRAFYCWPRGSDGPTAHCADVEKLANDQGSLCKQLCNVEFGGCRYIENYGPDQGTCERIFKAAGFLEATPGTDKSEWGFTVPANQRATVSVRVSGLHYWWLPMVYTGPVGGSLTLDSIWAVYGTALQENIIAKSKRLQDAGRKPAWAYEKQWDTSKIAPQPHDQTLMLRLDHVGVNNGDFSPYWVWGGGQLDDDHKRQLRDVSFSCRYEVVKAWRNITGAHDPVSVVFVVGFPDQCR